MDTNQITEPMVQEWCRRRPGRLAEILGDPIIAARISSGDLTFGEGLKLWKAPPDFCEDA